MTTPFSDDKLKRKAAAEYLTDYLLGKHATRRQRTSTNSYALNINAPWGIGKTYFLNNWASTLRGKGYIVITFDAWRNDFCDQPIIGFMSEIEEQLKNNLDIKGKARIQTGKLIQKGKQIIRIAPSILASTVAKHTTGLTNKEIHEIAESVSKESTRKIQEKIYAENKKLKNAISAFKKTLEATVASLEESGKRLPVFFFIDELDRCRPTYAIELLETIKHIFGVECIYFVIATDTEQLAAAVKAVYGSEFSSNKYLRRFFNAEYTFPELNNYNYAEYQLERIGFLKNQRIFNPLPTKENINNNARLFSDLSDFFGLTLRDQEQAAELLDTVALTTSKKIAFPIIATLATLKQANEELFKKIYNLKSSFQAHEEIRAFAIKEKYYDTHTIEGRAVKHTLSEFVVFVLNIIWTRQSEFTKIYNNELIVFQADLLRVFFVNDEFIQPSSYVELLWRASSLTRDIRTSTGD